MKIFVSGASGNVGKTLVRTMQHIEWVELVGGWCKETGEDLGEIAGIGPIGIIATNDLKAGIETTNPDIVIDFSATPVLPGNLKLYAEKGLNAVIGTTGLEQAHLDYLKAAARHAPIIRAGNMSLGVNLLVGLTRKVAAALGEDWDIEVVEAHHNRKVDAPSGTALMLGEAAAEGRGATLADLRTPARDGITGARAAGSIGFAAIRGGDVVGEHDVIFAGAGERIVLRHIATDRAIFARGALKAALWGLGQKPGQYDMIDVLGL